MRQLPPTTTGFDEKSGIAYREVGEGPDLLLLHGSLSSHRAWNPVVPLLEQHFRMIIPDLPGFGDSPLQTDAVTPQAWVPKLQQLLETCGVTQPPQCAGESVGGLTGLELAKAGLLSGLVSLCPAGLWKEKSPRVTNLELQMGRRMAPIGASSFGRLALHSTAVRRIGMRSYSANPAAVSAELAIEAAEDAARATGWKPHYLAVRDERFTGGAAISPDVPVLVVFGEEDRIAPPAKSQNTDQLPVHAKLVRWVGCGHLLTVDAPERVARVICSSSNTKLQQQRH